MMTKPSDSTPAPAVPTVALPGVVDAAPRVAHALFSIGAVVRHRMLGFRGVVFDVDPVFANSEDWYQAIPEALRPARDQPFYHLFAENEEQNYVAYVSQQNLEEDAEGGPIDHPAIVQLFRQRNGGNYELDSRRWH